MTSFEQPESNGYAPEVFQELMALAASFIQRNYYAAGRELEQMAKRGPDRAFAFDDLTDYEVIELATRRMHLLAQKATRPAGADGAQP